MKVEFLHDPREDITTVYVWNGSNLVDKKWLNGLIDSKQQKKITKEIQDETNKR